MNRPLIVVLESYVAGGADRVVANLLASLPSLPIELHLNDRCDPSVLVGAGLPPHVSIHYYAWSTIAEWSQWAAQPHQPWLRKLRQIFALNMRYPWIALLTIRCYLRFKCSNPQAVWVNNGGYPGGEVCRAATIAAGLLPGCRVVHMVHSMAQRPRWELRIPEYFIDRLVDRSALLIAVSYAVGESMRTRRSIKQHPRIIHNGLSMGDEPIPRSHDGVLRLLQVGYFDRNKNHALTLRALGLLRRNRPVAISLTFIGKEADSGLLRELQNLAASEGVSDQVTFAGFVTDVDRYYTQCDALVLTSFIEGLPVSVLESMRAGRAVVAPPIGGISELIIHNETGHVLANHGPEELAEVFHAWSKNPEKLALMGNAARKRFADHFQIKMQTDALAKALSID